MVKKGWIYMPKFKIISPSAITDNPFTLIGKDWALVTAGDRNRFNTMTVSWGGTGIMWNKPVTFTFIRPQRYTFGFMEENGCFSMSFFDESLFVFLRVIDQLQPHTLGQRVIRQGMISHIRKAAGRQPEYIFIKPFGSLKIRDSNRNVVQTRNDHHFFVFSSSFAQRRSPSGSAAR